MGVVDELVGVLRGGWWGERAGIWFAPRGLGVLEWQGRWLRGAGGPPFETQETYHDSPVRLTSAVSPALASYPPAVPLPQTRDSWHRGWEGSVVNQKKETRTHNTSKEKTTPNTSLITYFPTTTPDHPHPTRRRCQDDAICPINPRRPLMHRWHSTRSHTPTRTRATE